MIKALSSEASQKFIRYTLGSLLTFAALNAFGGGYYGMSGAEGVPVELLKGSPFNNYFIPSLILFVLVGGAFLTASISVFRKSSYDRTLSFAAVIIVFAWLAVQVAIIGYISWMQPVTAIAASIMLLLTWGLAK